MPGSEERDFVLPVPDKLTKKCTFYLMRGRTKVADVVFDDAVGPDGKAIFEKIVEAYDHFKALKREGRIT